MPWFAVAVLIELDAEDKAAARAEIESILDDVLTSDGMALDYTVGFVEDTDDTDDTDEED